MKISISTGLEVEFDEQAPKTLFEVIISDILIPKYKDNKDWNLTLNIVIEEMNEELTKKNRTILKYGKALQEISLIENRYDCGDWDEIEDARDIANKALGKKSK